MLDARRRAPAPLLVLLGALGLLALAAPAALLVAASLGPDGGGPDGQAPARAEPRSFPGAASTGVPDGTRLTPYTGPCTLTQPVVLRRVDATASCPAILVQAPDVVIEESRVPRVDATAAEVDPRYSVVVVDSEVRGGAWVGGTVWGYNLTLTRVEVTGGQHSVHCNDHCVVEDSWLHGQSNPDGGGSHNNAFLSNGGTDMVLRGNTLHCTPTLNDTGGGCTADLSLFGDFQPIRDVTVEANLFRANGSSVSYCAYGGHAPGKPHPVATGIVFTDNVFERGDHGTCGVYGAVTSFDPLADGNAWSGNTWDDGSTLEP